MRRALVYAGTACLFFLGICLVFERTYFNQSPRKTSWPAPRKPGDLVQTFTGKTIDGMAYNFSPHDASKTLIVFWASWCPPCAQETPSLIALARRHADWRIIAISNDSTLREIREFLKIFPQLRQNNIALIWDPTRELALLFGINALPESFLLDPTGRLETKFVGPVDWSKY